MTEQAADQRPSAMLRDSDDRLRLILDHVLDHAIFVTDSEGRVLEWGAGACALFGFSADEIEGGDGDILFTPEDREAGAPERERAEAIANGRAEDVRWYLRKDGSRVFIEGVSTLLGKAGRGEVAFLKIGRDATERHLAEQQRKALLAELQHRVRNTLGVVRSIVRRTAAGSSSVEDMTAHLEGRIDAFARVQAVVTRDPQAGIDLTSLVEEELLAYVIREGDRLSIDGPEIFLTAKAAESLSLAIHELATNAVKHGALGAGRGKISVSWLHETGPAGGMLRFAWEETGHGAEASAGPRGFGFELLEQYLPYELDAETHIDLGEMGLRFTMLMPLKGHVADPPRAGIAIV